MPKWKSPLFSDIRNAIGDNVVFSQWKGRPYVRSYVMPAQPRTAPQRAHRDVLRNLVKRWQGVCKPDDAVVALWDNEALAELVSGFNIFTKWGRLSKIEVSQASGSVPYSVIVSGHCGIPLAKAMLVQDKDGVLSIVKNKGEITSADFSFSVNITAVGTYRFYLADGDVLKSGDTAPKAYQCITCWSPDLVNGVAKEAKTVAS
jgi:hypothetical protein